jgi:hypothetical protein
MNNQLGFFYQCGHRMNNNIATYVNLKQLRSIYPSAPVSMWEDCHVLDSEGNGVYPLEKVSQIFNCNYHKIPYLVDYLDKNCYAVDLKTNLEYIERMYQASLNELNECEWIMLFEDDVWIQKEIETFPDGNFCGAGTEYLMNGGIVFKRSAFLEAYPLAKNIDWDQTTQLQKVHTDHFLPTIFHNANFVESLRWKELGYFNINGPSYHSVLHNNKLFYKQPYGLANTDEEDINDLSNILSQPLIQEFIKNYNVTIFA